MSHITWREAMQEANRLARALGVRRRVYRERCGCYTSVPLSLWTTRGTPR